ncbi:MAG: glycosyltransferase family 2 protein [Candidatus Nanoarchaeia archaeon]|nr:glycosyltransferase family 2 protein [Candidatus Nanoarchaeia archaeon]
MKNQSKDSQPKVSIVFLTLNSKEYSFDFIESLKKITYKNYDIIIVDNGSTDNGPQEIRKKYGKFVTVIENRKNLGYPAGTNIGMREALRRGSKYILQINDDMLVEKDFLSYLVDSMEKHPEVGVSTSAIYYMEPRNMIWCAGCEYSIKSYKPLNQGEVDHGQINEEKYVDACDCVLMIRAEVLKECGLLDESFFLIHEQTEWCLRIAKKGYKSLLVPKSKIWHKVSASIDKFKYEKELSLYYNIRNWLLTIKKNKSAVYFLFVLFLELTFLAGIRFFRYIKNKQSKLITTYYTAIWHALINKTPMEIYPYKK